MTEKIIVEVYCNNCKKKITEIEKEEANLHSVDYCKECEEKDEQDKIKVTREE